MGAPTPAREATDHVSYLLRKLIFFQFFSINYIRIVIDCVFTIANKINPKDITEGILSLRVIYVVYTEGFN